MNRIIFIFEFFVFKQEAVFMNCLSATKTLLTLSMTELETKLSLSHCVLDE